MCVDKGLEGLWIFVVNRILLMDGRIRKGYLISL